VHHAISNNLDLKIVEPYIIQLENDWYFTLESLKEISEVHHKKTAKIHLNKFVDWMEKV
jgi:hypothetical protein